MTTPRPQTRPRPAGHTSSWPASTRGALARRVARGAAADRRPAAALHLSWVAPALLLVLLAVPAAAQPWGVWLPSPGAFGDWRWAPPVLDVAALPAGSPDGEARLVLTGPDAGLQCHLAGAWQACGGGEDTDDQVAAEIPITDAGGLYTATEVEGALQETPPGPRDPTSHATTHDLGGADELAVAALWDGADLTLPLGTQIQVPYSTTAADPSIEWPSGSGIGGEASNAKVFVALAGTTDFEFQGCGPARCLQGAVGGGPRIFNRQGTLTTPSIVPTKLDDSSGLGGVSGSPALIATGSSKLQVDDGGVIFNTSAATCTDTGDAALGALTITPTTSVVYLTSSDPDGCTVTVSETGATDGQLLELELQASAGGTVTLADSPGATNLAGAWTPGPGDSLTLRYNATASEWRERARADL